MPRTPRAFQTFHSLSLPCSYLVGDDDLVMPAGESGRHPRVSSRLGDFRLVTMAGGHEALFTHPVGVAEALVAAGRDDQAAAPCARMEQ